jgi:hypothetical protein
MISKENKIKIQQFQLQISLFFAEWVNQCQPAEANTGCPIKEYVLWQNPWQHILIK